MKSSYHSERRLVLFAFAFVVAAVLLTAGIAAPLIILSRHDRDAAKERSTREARAVRVASERILHQMREGIDIAEAMRGFVLSDATEVGKHHCGSDAEAGQDTQLSRFYEIARYLASSTTNLRLVAVVPNGLVCYCIMDCAYVADRDIFVDYGVQLDNVCPAIDVARMGTTVVSGPFYTRPTDATSDWHFRVLTPVFIPFLVEGDPSALVPPYDLPRSFWGFTMTHISIESILLNAELDEYMAASRCQYILRTVGESGDENYLLGTSLPPETTTTEEYRDFLLKASSFSAFGTFINMNISVIAEGQNAVLTPSIVCIVVFVAILGSFVILTTASAAILYYTKEYDGRPYAPKLAPFAVLTIGPCWEEGLWDVASQELTAVSERLQRVLDKAMAAHHAYPIAQLHPYTSSYTTRSLDAAVHMAFSVLEELQRHPIDGPLRKAVGNEDGRLMVACAVHWCRDATVLMHSSNGEFRYDGPDMVAASQMWPLCAPNVVTISEEAKLIARLMQGVVVEAYSGGANQSAAALTNSSVDVNNLHIIRDPNSVFLREAEAAGRWRIPTKMARSVGSPPSPASAAVTAVGANNDAFCTSGGGYGGICVNTVVPTWDSLAAQLLNPVISRGMDARLRAAFEKEGGSHGVPYSTVRVALYLGYSSLRMLFRPLAVAEREHIHQRLVVAFGIPMRGIMEHLAARVAIHHIQEIYDTQVREQAALVYSVRTKGVTFQ